MICSIMVPSDLVLSCVVQLDPTLHHHLMSLFGPASSHAELMFFSRISSLFANRPPLSSIVRLWDAILAFGVQFVVVLCAAEALIRREELLAAGRDSVTRFQGIGSPAASKLLSPSTMTLIALELVTHVSPEILILLDKFASEQLHLHAPTHIRSYTRPVQDGTKTGTAAIQSSGTGSRSASLSRTGAATKRTPGSLENLGSDFSAARSRSVAPRTAPRYLQPPGVPAAHHPSSSLGSTEATVSRRSGAQGYSSTAGSLQLLLNAKSAIKARSQAVVPSNVGSGYKMAATRVVAKPGTKSPAMPPPASKITIQRTRAAQAAAAHLGRVSLVTNGKSNADTYAGK
jgi:hypothetical protein